MNGDGLMKSIKEILCSNSNLRYTEQNQNTSTGSLMWSSNQNNEQFLVTGYWQGIRCGRGRCLDDREDIIAK